MSYVIFVLILFVHGLSATVHIIGDSHARNSFTLCIDQRIGYFVTKRDEQPIAIPYTIHWIGAITMHRVGRDGLPSLNIGRFHIQEKDIVVFAFGEIDVRCHIGKQRDIRSRSLDEIIDTLIGRYIEAIMQYKKLYTELRCIVFNIIPPSDQEFNPEYPYYGSLEDRVMITKICNERLKNACHAHNILFLDVYDYYAQADGSLNPALSDGNVHIGTAHNHWVKEVLLSLISAS